MNCSGRSGLLLRSTYPGSSIRSLCRCCLARSSEKTLAPGLLSRQTLQYRSCAFYLSNLRRAARGMHVRCCNISTPVTPESAHPWQYRNISPRCSPPPDTGRWRSHSMRWCSVSPADKTAFLHRASRDTLPAVPRDCRHAVPACARPDPESKTMPLRFCSASRR